MRGTSVCGDSSIDTKGDVTLLKDKTPLAEIAYDLERYIPEQMKSAGVPGLSIAIVRNGEIAYARGFGLSSLFSKTAATPDTIFEAASLGKPITAYAALKLRDHGLLQLDKPLSSYLAKQYLGASAYRDKITMRHVLSHTSGLTNNPFFLAIRGPQFEPGSRFSYSGVGFRYLQNLVEQVTSTPFSKWIDREAFGPLALKSSSFERSPALDSRMATSYLRVIGFEIPLPELGRQSPNAANLIRSTAPDIARFMIELMDPRKINPTTVHEMLTEQVKVADAVSWGLGIGLQHGAAGDCFWHWGSNPGYKALMVGYPKQKIGVVIMTNSSRGLDIVGQIAQRAIGGADGPYWRAVPFIAF